MEGVQLLNRTDTKYLLTDEDFLRYLAEVSADYRALEIEGIRRAKYKTLYFDTPENLFYLQHHREKPTRIKVRKRQYVDSNLSFLEVKIKSKERTDKQRIVIDNMNENLSEIERNFVGQFFESPERLMPKLWNSFERITLVSKSVPERLTIDRNISFTSENNHQELKNLVVAEVKQEASSRNSTFVLALKREHVRNMGFSKYCMGSAVLNKGLKNNMFKEKFLHIKRLTNESAGVF
jgi:hypothetical protein